MINTETLQKFQKAMIKRYIPLVYDISCGFLGEKGR